MKRESVERRCADVICYQWRPLQVQGAGALICSHGQPFCITSGAYAVWRLLYVRPTQCTICQSSSKDAAAPLSMMNLRGLLAKATIRNSVRFVELLAFSSLRTPGPFSATSQRGSWLRAKYSVENCSTVPNKLSDVPNALGHRADKSTSKKVTAIDHHSAFEVNDKLASRSKSHPSQILDAYFVQQQQVSRTSGSA